MCSIFKVWVIIFSSKTFPIVLQSYRWRCTAKEIKFLGMESCKDSEKCVSEAWSTARMIGQDRECWDWGSVTRKLNINWLRLTLFIFSMTFSTSLLFTHSLYNIFAWLCIKAHFIFVWLKIGIILFNDRTYTYNLSSLYTITVIT